MKRDEDYQYTCPGCDVDDLNVIQLRQHIEQHIRDETLDPMELPIIFMPNNLTKDDFLREKAKVEDATTSVFQPIISEKALEAITDTSVKVPVNVGNKTESEFKELLISLITDEQLAQIREFLSDYSSACPCIAMENTCLGHQLANIFEIETPTPTEYKTYASLWDVMPKIPWDRKGHRVIEKKKEDTDDV